MIFTLYKDAIVAKVGTWAASTTENCSDQLILNVPSHEICIDVEMNGEVIEDGEHHSDGFEPMSYFSGTPEILRVSLWDLDGTELEEAPAKFVELLNKEL